MHSSFPAPDAGARVALVTGGGRGIGMACALKLASQGCKVAVIARSLDEVDEVAAAIHEGGGMSLSAVCDVSSEESVSAAVEACGRRLGPVDILINNAGQAHSEPLVNTSLETWQRMLDVNLTGTFLATRKVLPGMLERGWGRIVNIASVSGLRGTAGSAAYCAAKHGVVGFTRAVAQEVAGKGVTVNAVCPGWTDTDMLRGALELMQQQTGQSIQAAEKELLGTIPTGRFVTPEALATLVAFLTGDSARDITGSALVVDGGAHAA